MPSPQPSFAELGVPSDIVAALERRSITAPFPIQIATVPDALAGRDVCGKAPTGSGKTLAFGIGAVARLKGASARPKHPKVLVLTPTRELCSQVATELQSLAPARSLRVASFYGGVGYGPQLKALSRGVDIAVACPGRLADLIERRDIRLDAIEIVVIDEADRMADMGFLPSVKRLLDLTPDTRQTVLFSATLDGDIDVLVRRYQNDPVRHELEVDEDDTSGALHLFWKVQAGDRVEITAQVAAASGPTIVFCRTKHSTDRIARQLEQRGIRAAAIHGDRSQKQRERALASFVSGSVDALVATDVAARGIHVDGVNAVVHFDPPTDSKDYVHRSGRTARAGATGVVVSLVPPDKAAAVKRLQRDLGLPGGTAAPDTTVITGLLGEPRPPRARADRADRGGDVRSTDGRSGGGDGPRGPRHHAPDRNGRPVRAERTDRNGKPVRGERTDRNGKPVRAERTDRNGKPVRADWNGKPAKPGKPGKPKTGSGTSRARPPAGSAGGGSRDGAKAGTRSHRHVGPSAAKKAGGQRSRRAS